MQVDRAVEVELWRRAQDRRDRTLTAGMESADAALVPLVLALARLSAQRDARVIEGLSAPAGA